MDFKKGIFAVTPQRGVRLSEAALLAAARRSGFEPDRVVAPNGTSKQKPSERPQPRSSNPRAAPDEVAKELAPARAAFRKGEFQQALKLIRQSAEKPRPALDSKDTTNAKQNAREAEIQQLLALVNFALGRYDEAAAAAHSALHNGPFWKWETLSSHYTNTNEYTTHLQALEKSIRQTSTTEKRFLIGYHYLMLGHRKAAQVQFQKVVGDKPDDKLVRRLITDLRKAPGSRTK